MNTDAKILLKHHFDEFYLTNEEADCCFPYCVSCLLMSHFNVYIGIEY